MVADTYLQMWFIPIMCFLIASCWLSIAFVKDISCNLSHLSIGGTPDQNQIKLIENFSKIIHFYGDARQLSVKKLNININLHRDDVTMTIYFLYSIHSIIDEFNRIFESFPTGIILWCLSSMFIPLMDVQIKLVE